MENYRFNPEPQGGITWGSKVATGFDRLKTGLFVKWESELFLTLLETAKQNAKDINDLYPISFSEHGDLVFNCHQTGRKGGYAFHISRADVNIFFSTRKDHDTPNVWIDVGSESCWMPGYNAVISEIRQMIESYNGFIIKDVISEVHLCADFIGLDIEELPIDHYKFWITRANRFSCFQDRTQVAGITISQDEGELPEKERVIETGIEFGRGDIMLRIYDKTLELKRCMAKQTLFASVWHNDEFNEEPVTRVEFQLRRPVLKQMHANSLDDIEKRKCDIWKYLTHDWTRLADQEIDRKNRHQNRAAIHPWWQEVHNLKISAPYLPVKREYPKPTKDLSVLHDLIGGCVLSIGTILNRKHNDLEGVIAFGQAAIESKLRKMWNKRDSKGRREFEHKMKKRWSEIWPMGYEPRPL